MDGATSSHRFAGARKFFASILSEVISYIDNEIELNSPASKDAKHTKREAYLSIQKNSGITPPELEPIKISSATKRLLTLYDSCSHGIPPSRSLSLNDVYIFSKMYDIVLNKVDIAMLCKISVHIHRKYMSISHG